MKLALSIIALMPLALAPSVQAMVVVGDGIHCSEFLKVLDSPEERQAKEIAITSLYEKIRSYPEAVLNDIAAERGLDRLLWEKLEQNRRMRHWPSAGPATQSKKKSDPTQLASAGAKILSGLGFLSLSDSSGLPWVEPKLKAQYISQIVVGRFGTEPWNAAGSLVLDAIPSNEWPEVQKWLEQPLASDHGFVPAFDPVSQEWGMREPETGLIWFNASQPNVNWEEAKAYCKEKKQALATQEQWMSAEQHRIREVFPEMKTKHSSSFSRFFWSSTPYGVGVAYVFNGYSGYADYDVTRDERYYGVFARCVSAAAPGVRR